MPARVLLLLSALAALVACATAPPRAAPAPPVRLSGAAGPQATDPPPSIVCPLTAKPPELARPLSPASSAEQLCQLIAAGANGRASALRCSEEMSFAHGFALLRIEDDGGATFAIAGEARDGWRVLADVGPHREGHGSQSFTIDRIFQAAHPAIGPLLRIEAAFEPSDSAPRQLSEGQATSKVTTLCARVRGAGPVCFALPAEQSGAASQTRASVHVDSGGTLEHTLLAGAWPQLGLPEQPVGCRIRRFELAALVPGERRYHAEPVSEPLHPARGALLGLLPGTTLRFEHVVLERHVRCVTGSCREREQRILVVRDCPKDECPDRLIHISSSMMQRRPENTSHAVRELTDFTPEMGVIESVSQTRGAQVELRVVKNGQRSTFCVWTKDELRTALLPDPPRGAPASCPVEPASN